MNNPSYRKCVAIFVLQKSSGLFFAAERFNEVGAWQIPQGGVEENEDDYSAAIRELREETGITSVKLINSTKERYCYDFPDYVRKKRESRGWINYKGQAARFFLFEFIGDESEINLLTHPEEIEFSHWKWSEISALVDNMIEFKRDAIKKAAQELQLI